MLSLSSYSQQDTTKVVLPTKTARLIYQDLLRFDGCKQELSLTQFKLTKVEAREVQKDTIISLLETKDKNNQFIIGQKDAQLKVSEELTNSLHKELKGQRTKTFLDKVGTFVEIATSLSLFVK